MTRPAPARRVWPTRDLVWLVLTTLLATFAAGAAVAFAELEPVDEVLGLLAASALGLGLPVGLLLALRPERRAAIGLRRTPWGEIGRAFGWLLGLLPVVALVSLAMQALLGYDENPQAEALMLDRMSGARLAVVALFTVGVVPFVEELLFRGVLISALLERGPADPEARRRRALIVSSVLFGLIHIEPAVIVPTMVLGAAAGILRLRSASLWPAVTLHAANNAVATAVLAAGLG